MATEETLMYYSEESQNFVFKMNYLGFFLWVDVNRTPESQKEMIRAFIEYSKEFREQEVKFVITDLNLDKGMAFSRANGVYKDNIPQLRLIDPKSRDIFAYDGDYNELDLESLKNFYKRFRHGQLERFDVEAHINKVMEEEIDQKQEKTQ